MKMFLFFSHKLTNEQMDDAKKLGIKEFINLPSNLQELFSNVPAELDNLDEYVKVFIDYLLNNANKGDFILLQGDFGLIYKLINFSKTIGLIPIYATTKRITKEKIVNNKVIKTSEFKHIMFRKY